MGVWLIAKQIVHLSLEWITADSDRHSCCCCCTNMRKWSPSSCSLWLLFNIFYQTFLLNCQWLRNEMLFSVLPSVQWLVDSNTLYKPLNGKQTWLSSFCSFTFNVLGQLKPKEFKHMPLIHWYSFLCPNWPSSNHPFVPACCSQARSSQPWRSEEGRNVNNENTSSLPCCADKGVDSDFPRASTIFFTQRPDLTSTMFLFLHRWNYLKV